MNTIFDKTTGKVSYKKEVLPLTRTRIEIECVLAEEMQHLDDPNHPMDEMEWANNQGWIEALEWVLGWEQIKGVDIKKLTEGANDSTIKRALKRLNKQYGYGEKNETKISKKQRETTTELC